MYKEYSLDQLIEMLAEALMELEYFENLEMSKHTDPAKYVELELLIEDKEDTIADLSDAIHKASPITTDETHILYIDRPTHRLEVYFEGEGWKEVKSKHKLCIICGSKYEGDGNNPEPYDNVGQCCDRCNMEYVIPARILEE